jgi:conjugative transfer signal peptidase TraF
MSMRILILVPMLGSVMLTSISAAIDWPPVLIWNASASVPIGLYYVQPEDRLEVTDLVVVTPPTPVAQFLDERGYLPRGVPLLKQVLALPGQTVCRIRLAIMIDGVVMSFAREQDHRGRPLPAWQGCRCIAEGEVFLMNWQSADSLDGRYFGPLPVASILGRAVPLWTFADP